MEHLMEHQRASAHLKKDRALEKFGKKYQGK